MQQVTIRTKAEEELEGVLQNAGLDLVAWRSTRAVDLSGVDLHVVSFADERDEYKLNLQVKFSEVKSEQPPSRCASARPTQALPPTGTGACTDWSSWQMINFLWFHLDSETSSFQS